MLICPAHMHMHIEVLFKTGIPPKVTVGDPGVHGEDVAGMHGIGVKTPSAAVVAAATTGFAGDMHMPNGMMFTIGAKSMILAAICFPHCTRFTGSTISADGAIPIVHINCADITVTCAIASPCETLRNRLGTS